ncbi:MAG: glutamate-1-semialdehyde 2,1-aminomutase [Pyrinomonadaceae bacterium]
MSSPQADILHTSETLFERAVELLPGGVNSPVRAFRGVGGTPRFIASARGARMTDVEGKTYIDYVGSWGPMILGHADPEVIAAISDALARGTSYGAPTALEVEMAEEIIDAVPSIEMVRMVNSGTEATMSAVRLARGVTGRDKIIKFEGCYHGHGDSMLVRAGSGVATLGLPDSPGVPAQLARETLTVAFNDSDALRRTFEEHKEIAAVIIEPVVGNMGCVAPEGDFLQQVRRVTRDYGALLIFDEVMTGFRLARGGAQELYGVTPDITTLGKIIGGGLPVGAYGGSRELMNNIAPAGNIYQAGTLSGNPLAMTAGLMTLKRLRDASVYRTLERAGDRLCTGLDAAAREVGVATVTNRVGSMWTTFFTDQAVTNWTSAMRSDRQRFGRFFHAMLDEGVYLAPSQFEAGFISITHTDDVIDQTIEAGRKAFRKVASI